MHARERFQHSFWRKADMDKFGDLAARLLANRPELAAKAAQNVDWAAVDQRVKDEQSAAKMDVLRRRLPVRYRDAVTRHTESEQWLSKYWLNDFANFITTGPAGTGKTWEVCAVALQLLGSNVPVAYTDIVELVSRMRPGGDLIDVESYQIAPVLVLDDVGAEKQTEWVSEQIYKLVNYRYNQLLPTIYSTNLSLPELRERYGDRLFRRFTEDAVTLSL